MTGTNEVNVLRDALAEAEAELCNLGHTLVNEGWDTTTIACTLDVVRIALHGNDGTGNGIDDFERAREILRALRAAEAAT